MAAMNGFSLMNPAVIDLCQMRFIVQESIIKINITGLGK